MNIQSYETKTGKKGYVLKGAYIGVDSLTGEQVRTTVRGKTKKEVQSKLQRKIREFEENGCTTKKEASIKTFNDLIDAWIIYYQRTVKDGTYNDTESKLNRYIRPLIGTYKLEKITPALMQTKIDKFISIEAGRRKDYKNILSLMKRIFKYGVSLNLFPINPMENTLIHSIKTKEPATKQVKYYDKVELIVLLNHLIFDDWKKSLLATYIRLLVFTGMRAREALALEWSDIDFKNKTVTINKTLNKFNTLENTPKTKSSIRTIEIDSETLTTLNKWKQIQLEKSWELGLKQPKVIFWDLFHQKYYRYETLRRQYRIVCKGVGLPYIGLHGLRHTHATMYVNAGVDYKIIQERLGHENIAMTMNIYAHALTENKRDSLENVVKFMAT